MNFEKQIENLKMLRKIYNVVGEYGKFDTDYIGEVQRLGDAVQMCKSRNTIIVARSLPNNPHDPIGAILRHLFDKLSWEVGGDLVIQHVSGHGFVYGYKLRETTGKLIDPIEL